MAEGFIKLYKKMLKWEWYDDINTCRVFLHCLLRANWESGSWHGIKYDAGQFITSLQTLAVETKLSVKQVRTALEHLKRTNEVADIRQGNYRIITIVKWDEYQCKGRPSDDESANQGQTKGKPRATDKEIKEDKEVKDIKNKRINKELFFPNDDLLNKSFIDYLEYRKKIKKPLTDRGIELNIKRLNKLSGGDNDKAVKILEQSIMQGWQGLFELKEDKATQSQPQSLAEKWGL